MYGIDIKIKIVSILQELELSFKFNGKFIERNIIFQEYKLQRIGIDLGNQICFQLL